MNCPSQVLIVEVGHLFLARELILEPSSETRTLTSNNAARTVLDNEGVQKTVSLFLRRRRLIAGLHSSDRLQAQILAPHPLLGHSHDQIKVSQVPPRSPGQERISLQS